MSFDVFLSFDGDCRQALDFYGEVFRLTPPEQVMIYGQNPANPVADADKDRILYASLPIYGCNVMFSDCPAGSEFVIGNNIALTLGISDETELTRIYEELKVGGTVEMELGKTFFSELYAMVRDRFGVTWQLSKTQI